MTAAGFAALCKAKRASARSDGGETGGTAKSCNLAALVVREKLNVCSTCRGKKRPPELEIIPMEELTMATKQGLCESCGEKEMTVSPNHGVNMCSTCKTIHSHVRNRSETVVAAIKRLDLVDQYVGDLAADLVTTNNRVEELETALNQIRDAFDGPLPLGADLVAEVRKLVARRRSDREYIKNIGEALGVTDITMVDGVERCKDLAALARYAQPVVVEPRASARPMDSYILDLSLMVLRGEVTGLDPDFIGAMREAV